MRRFFGFLAMAPVSGFIAAAILIGTLWFLGELIPIGDMWRWIITGIIVFIYLLIVGIWWWRRRKRNKAMLAEMAEPEPDPTGEAIDAQTSELQGKFAAAMNDLSKLKFKSKAHGTRYVYELPWYIFIGPPGAGKTEALKNCGLEFPLRRGDESISIDGGAGTRDCDWVFTNEAVFIDTAGRYTTQGSNADVDAAGWGNFLSLLRKYRPREPINGVIIAISVKDIAVASNQELDEYASAVRARMQELCEAMDARIPVYVMFTKADLLIGFTEFFQSLRPSEREQVWGHTFPLGELGEGESNIKSNLAHVGDELDALLGQLGEMQFARLQDEPDLGARARIFGFPAQFATLKPVIERFLDQAFAPDRYSTPMLLRGFYFTSATQIGQPVDRLIATLSKEFGVEQRAVATLGGSGRSYFLSDLLKKVIFPEQGIISKTGKRKSPIGRYAAIAASVLLPLAFAGGLFMVYQHNQAQAASLNETIEGYKADIAALPINPVDDSDFISILPALDRLRAESERLKSDDAKAPLFGLGVDDTEMLAERADQAYQTSLRNLLLPRILYRYERLLEENLHRPGRVYNLLKTYLMAAGHGPLDVDFVKGQVSSDWATLYNPTVLGEEMLSLDQHLDAMLADEFLDPHSLNDEAVALARDAISQISIAERAYRAMTSSAEAQALEPWTVTSAGGRNADNVFTRLSGEPLDKPIPGLFTQENFWLFFMPRHAVAARNAQEETWLIADDPGQKPKLETITREMVDLYNDEYIDHWRGMLQDLRIVPFRDAKHAAEILISLSSTTSPLQRVLESTAKETAIGSAPGEDSKVMQRLKMTGNQKLMGSGLIGKLLSDASRDSAGSPGMPVQENFADIKRYVDGQAANSVMQALKRLYGRVARSDDDIKLLSTTDEAKELKVEIGYAPDVVNTVISGMLDQADTASSAGVRARIAEVWSSNVYPLCFDRLHSRYPFGTGDEISLGDLADIIGTNGAIDAFFRNELQQYVDTKVSPWRWRSSLGAALGMSQDRLAFFEQAAKLRDAFFPSGSQDPRLNVTVYPIQPFDEGVAVARFTVSGAPATFEKGSEQPSQLLWPGAQPANGASVTLVIEGFVDSETGQPNIEELTDGETGAWGMFKLVDKYGFRSRASGDRGRVRFEIGGRAATLELRMNSSDNPFFLREEMKTFRCPASL